jgi:hypothetical protein
VAGPFLRFAGGPVNGQLAVWAGEWPPPDSMVVARGKTTGMVAFTTVERIAASGVDFAEVHEHAELTHYRRTTYSQLPASVDASEHVARCAQYVEVPDV